MSAIHPARPATARAAVAVTLALVSVVGLAGCGSGRRGSTPPVTGAPVTTVSSVDTDPPVSSTTVDPAAHEAAAAEQAQLDALDSSLRTLDSDVGDMGSHLSRSHDTAEPDPAN